MHFVRAIAPLLTLALLVPACAEDDPVAVSDIVSIKLGGIKEGDVTDSQAARDKNVNSETGNPYGEFLKTVKAALGGDPRVIRVTSITVQMHADTTGVSDIGEVFDALEVFLADGVTTVPVGTLSAPSGTSLSVPVTATDASLETLQASLKKGDVKVGVRGPVTNPPGGKFELRLTVDIKFEAHQ
jgi:hypothetical protein